MEHLFEIIVGICGGLIGILTVIIGWYSSYIHKEVTTLKHSVAKDYLTKEEYRNDLDYKFKHIENDLKEIKEDIKYLMKTHNKHSL